ncbi:uncharacterized protein LOC116206870 [Punica granatum]|uniref:Uncharacterized protein LOC116206870 n=1 Tax=Punica granatum TaxID=22663 RepID=A0A218W2M1_PUNGR|nr:uncharacterized protein LOC116206870 [Punica granatum]OWM67015.1 hypothetical protein CDL15_Pgr000467 [Punica granatum]
MANSAANLTRSLILFLFAAVFAVVELAARNPVKSVQADLQAAYKFEPADISVENYPIPEAGNDDPRQQFAPFQICLPCKCCAAASPAPTCTTMPCCFGIDCQIPKKPFGFCAFVPKTCNCTSCAV